MSRQKVKGCARHSYRDYRMKKFFFTIVMVLLIGGFTFTANAQDRKTKPNVKTRARTEKQVIPVSKRQDLKNNVNESPVKVRNRDTEQKKLEFKIESDAKARAESENKVIKENNNLFDEFVETVDNCEKERNKKDRDKNQIGQYLEKALRLSKKINTKMLTDTQKDTFETYKAKLNRFLKG